MLCVVFVCVASCQLRCVSCVVCSVWCVENSRALLVTSAGCVLCVVGVLLLVCCLVCRVLCVVLCVVCCVLLCVVCCVFCCGVLCVVCCVVLGHRPGSHFGSHLGAIWEPFGVIWEPFGRSFGSHLGGAPGGGPQGPICLVCVNFLSSISGAQTPLHEAK